MNIFFACFLVGVSLSMDAFSLALIYGTYGINKKNMLLLASIVGLFHFFMPLFGLGIGSVINTFLNFDIGIVVPIIFGIIGVEMIISSIKNEDVNVLVSLVGFFLFGLSVSIDSFTTGIGLSVISNNYIGIACLFMIVSLSFTYIGLRIGNRLNNSFGKYSTICGGILLCILGIFRLLKW